ncbi:MAG: 2-C-methyl-D-erythritol 2,4-cyclodiphosphate synthase [Planctomycetota bacterium]
MDLDSLRIGSGFDIHRLEPGRPFILGGVPIPFDRGFAAHSDGDVLLHALIDALLGAAGQGDIGTHFPDSDPRYRGIASRELVAAARAAAGPLRILNVDMTILCEAPRLAPHRAAIEGSVAAMLAIPAGRVNLKNKTMEKLGPIGDGFAAAALVTLLAVRLDG